MSDKGTLQCYNKKKLKQDGYMSKRWFDLLATIGFGINFAMSCLDPNYFLTNKFFALNGFCLILIFALRRFFYNKEK